MYNYFTMTGPSNFMGHQSDEVKDLLEKARGTPRQAERAKLHREAEAQLAADAPILFLAFPAALQASTKSLTWLQYPDAPSGGSLPSSSSRLRILQRAEHDATVPAFCPSSFTLSD